MQTKLPVLSEYKKTFTLTNDQFNTMEGLDLYMSALGNEIVVVKHPETGDQFKGVWDHGIRMWILRRVTEENPIEQASS